MSQRECGPGARESALATAAALLGPPVSTRLLGRAGFLPEGVVMQEPLPFRQGSAELSPRDKRRLLGRTVIDSKPPGS